MNRNTTFGARRTPAIPLIGRISLILLLFISSVQISTAAQSGVYYCDNGDGTYTFYVQNYRTWEIADFPAGSITFNGTAYAYTGYVSALPPCANTLLDCTDYDTYSDFVYQEVTVSLSTGTYEINFTDDTITRIDDFHCLEELPLYLTIAGEESCDSISVDLGDDFTIYEGVDDECVTLTATATGYPPFTYSWSTGDTGSSIEVCPSTSQTYSVTVTDNIGCTDSDDVDISVQDISCGRRGDRIEVCWTSRRGRTFTLCVRERRAGRLISRGRAVLGPCPSTPGVDPNWEEGTGTETEIVSDNIYLHAFPNPFTDQLNIEFEVIDSDNVMVNILNLNGQLIQTVHDGYAEEGEVVRTSFNANNLSAGIYLIQVINAETTMTKKVVLTK